LTTEPYILVDATAIPQNRGGVGRYLEHLLPALAASGSRLAIASQSTDEAWLTESVPGAVVIPIPAATSRGRRLIWEQMGLPRLARSLGVDVIFSPHYTMPLATRLPVVVTLHDATFFSHPQVHSRFKRVFFRRWSRISLRRAAACVVPSQATRTELLTWVKPATDRMTVAYHGVNTDVFHAPTASAISAAADRVGSSSWIAFLGTLEPRKNVPSLIEAFGLITEPADLRLVLAGARGWDYAVDDAIAESPARDRIDRLGFVADDDLAAVLGGAAAFVYPSLGEGFGLPVLEAMACGAPVVTTPYLALPEVGGDVAIYTEPDAASIADAIRNAMSDTATSATSRRARGIVRAATFSWTASAQTHAAVFAAASSGVGVPASATGDN
jgi:glycosyltransferase involved in cell wall biosynthesis